MKKVVAGCIDLMLEFASVTELDKYIATIEAKKQACEACSTDHESD